MRTAINSRSVAVVSLCLLLGLSPVSAGQEDAKKPDRPDAKKTKIFIAEATIEITYSPGMTQYMIGAGKSGRDARKWSEVVQRVCREVLGEKAINKDWVVVRTDHGPRLRDPLTGGIVDARYIQQTTLELLDRSAKAARENTDQAIERLGSELATMHEQYVKQLEDNLRIVEERTKTAKKLFADRIADEAKYLGRSQKVLEAEIMTVRRIRASKSLELSSVQARLKAIQTLIDKVSAQAAERVKDDPIARELELIVKLREKAVATGKDLVAASKAGESEMDKWQIELAEARIRLARRREEVAGSGSSDQVTKFNQEMMRLTIDRAESEQRLVDHMQVEDRAVRELLRYRVENPGRQQEVRAAEAALSRLAKAQTIIKDLLASARPPQVKALSIDMREDRIPGMPR